VRFALLVSLSLLVATAVAQETSATIDGARLETETVTLTFGARDSGDTHEVRVRVRPGARPARVQFVRVLTRESRADAPTRTRRIRVADLHLGDEHTAEVQRAHTFREDTLVKVGLQGRIGIRDSHIRIVLRVNGRRVVLRFEQQATHVLDEHFF